MKALLAILGFTFALTSCKQDVQECFVPTSVSVKVGFKVIDTIIGLDSLLRPDTTVAIRDTALYYPSFTSLNQDSNIVFQGARSVTGLTLFLNPDLDTIKYVFQPNQNTAQIVDTISLVYDHFNHFISNACGYTYYYTINNASSQGPLRDSLWIKDPNVSLSAQSNNLIIYFFD